MFGLDQPSHLLILLIVLVLLFGSTKLPKAAKSLGESMRIFKKEAQKLHDDDRPSEPQAQVQAVQQQPLPAPPPVAGQPAQDGTAGGTAVPETQRTNQAG